jgi:hypothetical protein
VSWYEEVVRHFQSGQAEETAHTSEHLRVLAKQRHVPVETIERVDCAGCGVSGAAGAVFGLLGLGHWPDCQARDSDIHFIRRRR